MLILIVRTDKPEAEVELYKDRQLVAQKSWLAHRQLAETLHKTITDLLVSRGKSLHDIEGIAVFEGPGSFTGLRIGISVANALAYSLQIPIVSGHAHDPAHNEIAWMEPAIDALLNGKSEVVVLPEYGALPNISQQKK